MGEYYHKKFNEVITLYSVNKEDPIPEWILHDNPQEDKTECICTKDISLRWPITNKLNGQILWIGGDCAERWLNPSLSCDGCGAALGCVMKRRREKNYLCRSCTLKSKKEREKRIKKLASYQWNGQRFDSFSEKALEHLYNSELKFKTIQYLREYVELVYLLEEETDSQT
jgi:hypothetical protein